MLDLATDYWQVKVSLESREKTAFMTQSGLYEFIAMLFGLCNVPVTFQSLMKSVLAGLTYQVSRIALTKTGYISRICHSIVRTKLRGQQYLYLGESIVFTDRHW